jgi:hypothetical protein
MFGMVVFTKLDLESISELERAAAGLADLFHTCDPLQPCPVRD